MITTKDILEEYITADAKANGVKLFGIKNKLKNRFNPIWQFLVALRRYEYTRNHCKRNILTMLIFLLRWKRYHRLSVKLGFSIPPNVCNRGLSLPHYGNIVINPACKIGKNCRIHVGVNIGANGGSNGALLHHGVPRLRDDGSDVRHVRRGNDRAPPALPLPPRPVLLR